MESKNVENTESSLAMKEVIAAMATSIIGVIYHLQY